MSRQSRNPITNEWLKTDEVSAAGFPFSASWLEKKRLERNSDGPPFVRVGRCIFYRRSALDEYLIERTYRSVVAA